jgi:phosphate acetyltransferase/phosphate butyryltransferase
MLAEQLEHLADAQIAGLIVGARVPVIPTHRSDGPLSRLGSCALALLLVHHKRLATGVPATMPDDVLVA